MLENKFNLLRLIGLIMLFIGLLLMGFSVTGNIVLNKYDLPNHCSIDADCLRGEKCCITNKLAEESIGLCIEPLACYNLNSDIYLAEIFPFKKYSSFSFKLGMSLLIVAVILLIASAINKKDFKSSLKTVRNRKKKK